MAYFMGIDIGSGASKGVVTKDGELLAYHLLPSGVNYRAAAEKLREELLVKAGLILQDIAYVVATGQGSANVTFCNQKVTDIRCCARGIHKTFFSVRTVIDVQAQSSQVIKLSESGQVTNFVVSKDIGPLSLKSKNPVTFTTGCAVFGESEAISRVAEGSAKEDILAGVHRALADKISALIDRVGLEKDCAISGGGGLDVGLIKSLDEKLGIKLLVPPQPQVVTAFGAAIMAREMAEGGGN
jgi:activator of 2-hydroxyglutaryl-CoA dehydratase